MITITDIFKINEDKIDINKKELFDNLKKIKSKIDKELLKFFNDNNIFLYRGYNSKPIVFCAAPREKRSPADSPLTFQYLIDNILKSGNVKALRENSFFSTLSKETASKYGDIYIQLPFNNFDFYCNLKISDMYENFFEDRTYAVEMAKNVDFEGFKNLLNLMYEKDLLYVYSETTEELKRLLRIEIDRNINIEKILKTGNYFENFEKLLRELIITIFGIPENMIYKQTSIGDYEKQNQDLIKYILYKMGTTKEIKFKFRNNIYGDLLKEILKDDRVREKFVTNIKSYCREITKHISNSLINLFIKDPKRTQKSDIFKNDYLKLNKIFETLFNKSEKMNLFLKKLLISEKNAIYGSYPADKEKFKSLLIKLRKQRKDNEILIKGNCCFIEGFEFFDNREEIVNYLLKKK